MKNPLPVATGSGFLLYRGIDNVMWWSFQTYCEISDALQIVYVNDEDWEIGDQVIRVFKESNIYVDSTKEVILAAMIGDNVVGGVAASWSDNDEGVREFSFDVAVSPEYRRPPNLIGMKLISDTIQYYESESSLQGDETRMRLDVVNPRLASVLEKRFGFKVVNRIGHHIYMTRY